MKLFDIVDSLEYVDQNCYQHQVSQVLDRMFDVTRIPLAQLSYMDIPAEAPVISRLRLRTLVGNLMQVSLKLARARVVVYEQDAWENFITSSPYRGSYMDIYEQLRPTSFLTMSKFWSNRVQDQGLPCKSFKMWVQPDYVTGGKPWADRKHDVVFSGRLYPHRIKLLDELEKTYKLKVEIVPTTSYQQYLDLLRDSKVTIRSEQCFWKCDFGRGPEDVVYPQAQWQRDVEAAAQGCYSLREWDHGHEDWELNRIPLIRPFGDPKHASLLVQHLLSSHATVDADQQQSLQAIKLDKGLLTLTDAVHDTLNPYSFENVYDRPEEA